MKHLTLLLAAALLVFNLTACGCSAKDSGSTTTGQETTGTTEDSTSPNTGTSNGESGAGTGSSSGSGSTSGSNSGGSQNGSSGGSGEAGSNTGGTANSDGTGSLLEDAGDALKDGANDVKDALDGSSKAGGVSFRQMVRNARVHDTDGDLTDGENSRSDGKLF